MPKKDSEADKADVVFVHRSVMSCNPATLEAVFRNAVSSIPVELNSLSTGGELCAICNAALGEKPD